ncbi:MAG: hypothetical protein NT159_12010 [Proteobacteria bacterium]|nr:hypothetical protein [Pseudomonadota bacterium]
MKRIGLGLTLLLILGAAASSPAWADYVPHRGHHHGGGVVYIGGPWPGYYYGYPPFYYPPYPYPPVVVSTSAPPVYIEKQPAVAPQAPAYWYFCSSPEGYYPYVNECPAGWQKVAPQPQASPQ